MQAAAHFPGGPTALVFALFWAPVGPGVPAGVLLARQLRLAPALTFGLYVLSDVLAIVFLMPIYSWLRTRGREIPLVRKIGRRVLAFAMIGTGRRLMAMPGETKRGAALFRVATVGFGVDIYTAGAIATGLPIPRVPGWAAALVGDVLWFALVLASSLAAASVFSDERVIAGVVIAVTLLVPPLLQRLIPALRP